MWCQSVALKLAVVLLQPYQVHSLGIDIFGDIKLKIVKMAVSNVTALV